MKKRIVAYTALFVFAVLSTTAYGKYGGITTQYYWGLGWAGAKYCGTTKNLTIEEVHNDRLRNTYSDKTCGNVQSFSGKLSKRQSNLLWRALEQYDYATGEIYSVSFAEEGAPGHHFCLTVEIEADGSCTWIGFTYDILY
ncbi:MAG: hypothetical protein K2J81_10395 [Treponemataceae bacterium]|nr:hypothetical protein [Treponemataceae bacterium]